MSMKEEMVSAGLSNTMDYLEELDSAACALTSVQVLIEGQKDLKVDAQQVAYLLDFINDALVDCVTAWGIERKGNEVTHE